MAIISTIFNVTFLSLTLLWSEVKHGSFKWEVNKLGQGWIGDILLILDQQVQDLFIKNYSSLDITWYQWYIWYIYIYLSVSGWILPRNSSSLPPISIPLKNLNQNHLPGSYTYLWRWVEQGSLYYQPKQGTIIWEIPTNLPYICIGNDPSRTGNLMTPVETPNHPLTFR